MLRRVHGGPFAFGSAPTEPPVLQHVKQAMCAAELSLARHITGQVIREVWVDRVIIGMQAISLKAGTTNEHVPEVMIDRTIIGMAPELVVVSGNTKLEQVASAYAALVERFTILDPIRTSPPFDKQVQGRW